MNNKLKLVVKNLNAFIDNAEFIIFLRSMTLNPSSGMNKELSALLEKKRENGVIDAKAIIAYSEEKALGWALFSRENSNCCYNYRFHSNQGVLFQVYIDPSLRKMGIATKLLTKAARMAGSKPLCVIPWDEQSTAFYKAHKNNIKLKSLSDYIDL